MSLTCRSDPVVCIDAIALFVGEFLKDWTTLGMLSVLLFLLLRLRMDQQRKREAEYSRQMMHYAEQRKLGAAAKIWEIGSTP